MTHPRFDQMSRISSLVSASSRASMALSAESVCAAQQQRGPAATFGLRILRAEEERGRSARRCGRAFWQRHRHRALSLCPESGQRISRSCSGCQASDSLIHVNQRFPGPRAWQRLLILFDALHERARITSVCVPSSSRIRCDKCLVTQLTMLTLQCNLYCRDCFPSQLLHGGF